MKTGNSKLYRKLHLNRRSGRLSDLIKRKAECPLIPIENWWKAKNVKDA